MWFTLSSAFFKNRCYVLKGTLQEKMCVIKCVITYYHFLVDKMRSLKEFQWSIK